MEKALAVLSSNRNPVRIYPPSHKGMINHAKLTETPLI